MDMKKLIEKKILTFVRDFQNRENIQTEFGEPIVGVADAFAPEIQGLKELIGPDHELPQQVLPDAKSVIAYFVPFTRELAATNRRETGAGMASPQWARAYEELNFLFGELNAELVELIGELGEHIGEPGKLVDFTGESEEHLEKPCGSITAVIPKAASEFDETKLVSNWSHRHMAYAAGLGTFGINNMLITRKGCCGRFSSIVTNMGPELLPTERPMEGELCLYKANGSCGICLKNCPGEALQPEISDKFGSGFVREKCYRICLENAARYPVPEDLTSAYGFAGSQVCGKCITGSPCAFREG